MLFWCKTLLCLREEDIWYPNSEDHIHLYCHISLSECKWLFLSQAALGYIFPIIVAKHVSRAFIYFERRTPATSRSPPLWKSLCKALEFEWTPSNCLRQEVLHIVANTTHNLLSLIKPDRFFFFFSLLPGGQGNRGEGEAPRHWMQKQMGSGKKRRQTHTHKFP